MLGAQTMDASISWFAGLTHVHDSMIHAGYGMEGTGWLILTRKSVSCSPVMNSSEIAL